MKFELKSPSDVLITGASFIVASGRTVDELTAGVRDAGTRKTSLADFNAAPYLRDKRMLKAMSHRDSIAIACLERMLKEFQWSEDYAPFRRGYFVGASPSLVCDYENYRQAVQMAIAECPQDAERLFGKHFQDCKPTTLLLGLPNNVLCYGAMLAACQGPNNNFTSGGISAHAALAGALRSFSLNRQDCAIVHGYATPTDPYLSRALNQESELNADGAVTLALERRDKVRTQCQGRSVRLLGSWSVLVPSTLPQKPTQFALAVKRLWEQASRSLGISQRHINMMSIPGNAGVREVFAEVLQEVPNERMVSVDAIWGDLGEAGGIMDLALMHLASANEQKVILQCEIGTQNGVEMVWRRGAFGELSLVCASVES